MDKRIQKSNKTLSIANARDLVSRKPVPEPDCPFPAQEEESSLVRKLRIQRSTLTEIEETLCQIEGIAEALQMPEAPFESGVSPYGEDIYPIDVSLITINQITEHISQRLRAIRSHLKQVI